METVTNKNTPPKIGQALRTKLRLGGYINAYDYYAQWKRANPSCATPAESQICWDNHWVFYNQCAVNCIGDANDNCIHICNQGNDLVLQYFNPFD